jgi:hypothetical protein
MATPTITVHIGASSSIDGGPFENVDVLDVDPDAGAVYVDRPQGTTPLDVRDVTDDLTREILDHQPVNVRGQPMDSGPSGTVPLHLPVPDGYMVVTGGASPHGHGELLSAAGMLEAQQRADEFGADITTA